MQARLAAGQKYEVGYQTEKTGRSAASVKKAVKSGNNRRRIERRAASFRWC
ncbi:DUF3606 domain-containing protein [Bradyrhizobium pachyrhizi]|uniref:DUF3606 domain-containing protein n=1 Tax=Bradyrhizobium pachyrhizi TaxID=280333 RepID=A0A844T9U3_9BRAD|nr:DUF3606 domain-containing protein [Bradyrhizobium pachyrhizi]MVT71410.1 DUF3606 domain-containing protein [Bradyrhizobium pachyrhizi]